MILIKKPVNLSKKKKKMISLVQLRQFRLLQSQQWQPQEIWGSLNQKLRKLYQKPPSPPTCRTFHLLWESPQGGGLLGEGKEEKTGDGIPFNWATKWGGMHRNNVKKPVWTFIDFQEVFEMVRRYDYKKLGNNARIKQTKGNRKRNISLVTW